RESWSSERKAVRSIRCVLQCKTQALAWTRRAWDGSLMLFTPPNRREWVWDWRSVAPLLRTTAAGFGPYRMMARAQHFNSRCRLVVRENRLLSTLRCATTPIG